MQPTSRFRFLALAGVCLAGLSCIWPGDVPWISDEPVFIQRAVSANASGVIPATAGLTGSAGVPYGPVAIRIYQLLLLVTDDLQTLVVLKAFASQAITFLALLFLARAMAWPLLPAFWLVLTPFFWFYSRILWDNVFLIPLSALALSAALQFCARPRRRTFALWSLACTGMALLHPMSIPIIGATSFQIARSRARWFWENRKTTAAIWLLCLGLAAPYIWVLTQTPAAASAHPNLRPGSALSNAFTGFRFFTAVGFFDRFVPQISESSLAGLAPIFSWVTGLGAVFFAVGLWLSRPYRRLWAGAAVTALLISLFCRLAHHYHYLNALWPLCFPLVAIGVERLCRFRWGRVLCHAQTAALAFCTAAAIWVTHQSGGNRVETYGTALGEQMRIAKLLSKKTQVRLLATPVQTVSDYPHALQWLVDRYGNEERPGKLSLTYRDSEKHSGWLELKRD